MKFRCNIEHCASYDEDEGLCTACIEHETSGHIFVLSSDQLACLDVDIEQPIFEQFEYCTAFSVDYKTCSSCRADYAVLSHVCVSDECVGENSEETWCVECNAGFAAKIRDCLDVSGAPGLVECQIVNPNTPTHCLKCREGHGIINSLGTKVCYVEDGDGLQDGCETNSIVVESDEVSTHVQCDCKTNTADHTYLPTVKGGCVEIDVTVGNYATFFEYCEMMWDYVNCHTCKKTNVTETQLVGIYMDANDDIGCQLIPEDDYCEATLTSLNDFDDEEDVPTFPTCVSCEFDFFSRFDDANFDRTEKCRHKNCLTVGFNGTCVCKVDLDYIQSASQEYCYVNANCAELEDVALSNDTPELAYQQCIQCVEDVPDTSSLFFLHKDESARLSCTTIAGHTIPGCSSYFYQLSDTSKADLLRGPLC
jgi:hypothetical protein